MKQMRKRQSIPDDLMVRERPVAVARESDVVEQPHQRNASMLRHKN